MFVLNCIDFNEIYIQPPQQKTPLDQKAEAGFNDIAGFAIGQQVRHVEKLTADTGNTNFPPFAALAQPLLGPVSFFYWSRPAADWWLFRALER